MAQQTRKDPRAKVLSMTVRYKSATLDEFIEHHSHDVSCGGMFIKTPQPFTRGTLLKFEVRIGGDKKVMQGVGRVVWKRELAVADAEHPAGMGVSFIKLDDESRRLIDQLVHSRQGEASAFDAEREGTGVDAESTVGLGNDPLPAATSKGPPSGPSFFPKNDPAQAPPPEDRTVMKQAAELLEEALREVDTEPPAKPTVVSLAPVGDAEEKEDTKPGRPSRSEESSKSPSPAAQATGMLAKSPGISSAKPPEPASISSANPPAEVDMASVAQDFTAKARQATESAKPHKPAPTPPPRVSGRPATVTSPVNVLERDDDGFEPKPQASQRSAALAQATSADRASTSGSGRALFWFLAVAACAAGTWWLWKPRPIEPPPPDEFSLQPTQPKVDAPAAVPELAVAPSASAGPSAAAASVAEPIPAVPHSANVPSAATAVPQPPSTVAPSISAAAPATAVAAPPALKAVTARPKPKPTAEQTANESSAALESSPPSAAAPPAIPGNGPQNSATSRPSASPPAPKPKPATPATDSDNPY